MLGSVHRDRELRLDHISSGQGSLTKGIKTLSALKVRCGGFGGSISRNGI